MNILDFIKFDNYYCQINPSFQKTLSKKISNYSKTAQKIETSCSTISRILNKESYWVNFMHPEKKQKLKNLVNKYNKVI